MPATSAASVDSTVLNINNQPAKCNNAPKKTTGLHGFIKSLTASKSPSTVGYPNGSTDTLNREMVERMEQATQEAV